MKKDLLEIKKAIKKKHPKFIRQDYYKWDRLDPVYRKPKGGQSKVRHKLKSRLVYVQNGYRTPVALRHATKSGLKNALVKNVSGLKSIDPKTSAVTVASVGTRKQIEIFKAATEKKFKILNLPKDFLEKTQKKFDELKKSKAEKVALKAKKSDEKSKKAKKADEEKAKKESEQISEEEKAKKEKVEKDKALIKKN